jgi:H+/Cl- antiporter ClcA
MTTAAPSEPVDPGALIRSRGYIALLVLAGVVGIIVSIAGWAFLEVETWLQHAVYEDLPEALGFTSTPAWWPIPPLVLAGILVGFAIERLPGRGGHNPAGGLAGGAPTPPSHLPGVVLAAVAGLGLGVVLGPEAPLIALGGGLGALTVHRLRRGSPDQVRLVMGAAGSFAAISTIFGNPIIGAVLIIEAAGLGGAMLPLILLPGLIASGIGSLVFLGLGSVSGLDSSAYALAPIHLPPAPPLTIADFVVTIAGSIAIAIAVRIVIEIAWGIERLVHGRSLLLVPVAGLAIALCAIAFAQLTGQPATLVLLSGEDAMGPMVESGLALPAATLVLLILAKGLAWAISLGAFRGGPTFPAMFLGLVGGVLLANVFGVAETPVIAVGIAATTVAMLRLPLSSVILATVVTQVGLSVTPLVIVAVVVAYIATELMGARRGTAQTRSVAAQA